MFRAIGFPFLLFSLAVYFLPTIIAITRKKTNQVGILLVNFLLGWSVIGWIVALVWAVSTERVDQISSAPGVSMPPPRRRFCSSCGREDLAGVHFCPHCGQAFS
jgi:hypothetical protein